MQTELVDALKVDGKGTTEVRDGTRKRFGLGAHGCVVASAPGQPQCMQELPMGLCRRSTGGARQDLSLPNEKCTVHDRPNGHY